MSSTIKDIAKHLNISVSTVSYALNGGPRVVGDELKKKVLAAARELDYRPNRVARALVTRTANAIGVVPPSVETNVFLSPFVSTVWNAIVNEAEIHGQDLLLFTGQNRNTPEEHGTSLLDGRIDGVLFIAPRPDASALSYLADREFPFASITSDPGAPGLRFNADNRKGVFDALDHLYALGHRRIAHISGPFSSPDAKLRTAAFLEYARRRCLQIEPEYVQQGAFTTGSGHDLARRVLTLPLRPTAILAGNDEMAYGVYAAARELGLTIPNELSVVGFDDASVSVHVQPMLTTVRQPIAEMAAMALNSVVSLLSGTGEDIHSAVLPTSLIVRDSTGDVPSEGEVA